MADLIAANRDLILMLPRFGIKLGFGEKNVKDVCEQYSIDVDFFLLICNIYTFDDYAPDEDFIASVNIDSLLAYLEASHRYYLNERMPHMQRHLDHIAERTGESACVMLKKYFADYRAEVADQFAHEEKDIFPQLRRLHPGQKLERGRVERLAHSHENIKDRLTDLTQLIYKYLPGDFMTEELMELVFGILQLSKDLEKHTLIEDMLLAPDENYDLSEREIEVLSLLAQGLSSKEIASRLNIAVNTVNTHRKNITKKTGMKSVAALAVYATINGMIK